MSELLKLRPIQPVDLPGFQYSIARPQAGRNKYQDLADVLSKINPALAQFGRISAAKQQLIQQEEERKRKEYEAQVQAGREAAYFGGDPISDGLKKVSRKAVESGQLLDKDNAAFQIGALQAQGVTVVKGPYRDELYSQVDTLEGDIGEFIEQTRLNFIKRPEFANPSVRSFAFEEFNKVEEEFRNDVEKRRDEVRTDTFKRAWLELGRPIVNGIISGELDVNDPNMIGWLNHSAGVFKGSQEYAWNNLIKEDLKEGLSTGDLTPSEVKTFLNDLRELDLGGGVKFADAETGNAITDFIDYVDNKAATYESRANAKINEEYDALMRSSIQVFLNEWSEDGSISEDTFKNEANRLASLVPPSKTKTYLLDLRKQFSNLNKAKDEATTVTYSNRILELEQGKDLDELKDQLLKDVTQGAITQPQFAELNSKLESYRDFNNNFIKTDTYRTLSDGYEEVILGFRTQTGWDPSKIQNHFERIGSVGGEAAYEKDNHLYGRIKKLKGESAAKIYLNNRYSVFKKEFKESLKSKFDGYLEDGKSVAEARKILINEAVQVGTDIFEKWSQDSITLATQLYGI